MNLARVLEEGIASLILGKLFKNEIELEDHLCGMLELGFVELELQTKVHHIEEYGMTFELNNKKYGMSVCCNVLIDKKLIPYACIVFEKNDEVFEKIDKGVPF